MAEDFFSPNPDDPLAGNSENPAISSPSDSGFAGGGTDPESLPSAPPTSPTNPVDIPIIPGDLSDYFAGVNISDAVLRVSFDISLDPYTSYTQGYFGIFESSDKSIKTFVGFFETSSGSVIQLINIPLIGQSLASLVKNLNAYTIIRAEILNDSFLLNTKCLEVSPLQKATSIWSFFFKVESCADANSEFSNLDKDLKFFLTSVEPLIEQSNPTQSLGGFVSPTPLYDSSVLSYPVSFYDTVLFFNDDVLSSYENIQINDEIISIEKWESNKAYVKNRNEFGTPIRFHPEGSIAKGLKKSEIFDGILSKNNTQYRCLAIKNTSSYEIAHDVKFYFKIASRNSYSNMKIAVETPRSEYYSGTCTGGTTLTIECSDLKDMFEENHFIMAPLTFISGNNSSQTRIVSKFDSVSGQIYLEEAFPYTPEVGDSFYIDTSPSQIISSGIDAPQKTSDPSGYLPFSMSDFFSATYLSNAVSINIEGKREHGVDLYPNEVVYVWIERRIESGNEEFLNSRSVLSISYSRV